MSYQSSQSSGHQDRNVPPNQPVDTQSANMMPPPSHPTTTYAAGTTRYNTSAPYHAQHGPAAYPVHPPRNYTTSTPPSQYNVNPPDVQYSHPSPAIRNNHMPYAPPSRSPNTSYSGPAHTTQYDSSAAPSNYPAANSYAAYNAPRSSNTGSDPAVQYTAPAPNMYNAPLTSHAASYPGAPTMAAPTNYHANHPPATQYVPAMNSSSNLTPHYPSSSADGQRVSLNQSPPQTTEGPSHSATHIPVNHLGDPARYSSPSANSGGEPQPQLQTASAPRNQRFFQAPPTSRHAPYRPRNAQSLPSRRAEGYSRSQVCLPFGNIEFIISFSSSWIIGQSPGELPWNPRTLASAPSEFRLLSVWWCRLTCLRWCPRLALGAEAQAIAPTCKSSCLHGSVHQ